MDLLLELGDRIADGVTRGAITKASEWARKYRYIKNPKNNEIKLFGFSMHPWIEEMHDIICPHIVGQKSAQMGYTEVAINRAFKSIDIDRQSVLYVLPTERPDAVDFSSSRFDPALEMSPHLASIFSDTKNLGLKRAGVACLYVRSARSRSQLKSIPAANLYFDEMDEMDEAAVTLGRERSAGQLEKFEFDISTPTAPDFGINAEFKNSDQRHFMFQCPHCSRYTEMSFPDCIVITADNYYDDSVHDSYYICKECKHKLDHFAKQEWLKGKWVPSFNGRNVVGYHVNQMYSFMIPPNEFAIKALRRYRSEHDEQEFYNSNLGLPHVVKGARVDDEDINIAISNYESAKAGYGNQFICMGVDVGNKLHVEITEYKSAPVETDDINLSTHAIVLCHTTVDEFEDLDVLMKQYDVNFCVVDRQPEQRKAKEFTNRWRGMARTCVTTGEKISGRDAVLHDWTDEDSVSIDRTSWLDMALRRFKSRTIKLPIDTGHEYKVGIKAPIRIYKKNAKGEPRGTYVAKDPDHYAFARVYCEIALKVGMSIAQNANVTGVI